MAFMIARNNQKNVINPIKKSLSETNNYMRRNKNCYFPGITDLAAAYTKNILNPDVTVLQQFYCDADDMEIWFPD